MNSEMILAVRDLKAKQEIYSLASKDFEDVAYFEIKAAEARIDGIRREAKRDARNNLQRQC